MNGERNKCLKAHQCKVDEHEMSKNAVTLTDWREKKITNSHAFGLMDARITINSSKKLNKIFSLLCGINSATKHIRIPICGFIQKYTCSIMHTKLVLPTNGKTTRRHFL